MLDQLRSGAKSWLSKLLMGLLVLSFAVWGISGTVLNVGQNNVAQVGDEKITDLQFDQAYRRRLEIVSRQFGRPLSTTEGAALGIHGQVLGQLIAEAALNDDARQMNLGLSDEELLRLIQSDPAFQGPSGGYDRNRLAQLLRSIQMSEDDFVRDRRQLAVRQQITESIAGGMSVPLTMVEALNLHGNEVRTIRYMVLSPELAGEIADPDQAALEAFFEANKAGFRAAEFRAINTLELTPESIARPAEVTDEALRDAYDRSGDRFGEPERRRILQISFPTLEEAKAAADKLTAGMTFEELYASRSLQEKDIDLGKLTKTDLLDPTIADTAFSLQAGETSGAVEGRITSVILKVAEVDPAHTRAFEEVEGELRTELATVTAEREVLDLHDEVEDARAGGATLEEVATRFNLPLNKLSAFDRSGNDLAGKKVDLPEARDLITEVFESDIGVENDPLPLGRRGFIWFEVAEVTPERDRALEEVRAEVLEKWRTEERAKRLEEISQKAKGDLEDGKSLDDVAAGLGLAVKVSEGFTRSQTPGELTADAVAAAFSGPTSTAFDVAGKDGNRLVLVVDSISAPAFFAEAANAVELERRLSRGLQDSIISQYVGEVEDQMGVSVNQAAISRLLGLGGGG